MNQFFQPEIKKSLCKYIFNLLFNFIIYILDSTNTWVFSLLVLGKWVFFFNLIFFSNNNDNFRYKSKKKLFKIWIFFKVNIKNTVIKITVKTWKEWFKN